MNKLLRLVPALLLVPALQAGDGFENGANPNGLNFGSTSADILETSGGNPGGWLHNDFLDTFAPILRSGPGSAYAGDYRAMGVTGLTVDAQTISNNFGAMGFEFSLLLRDTKGTADVNDDDYAYFVGPQVPQPGQGWVSYDFEIPSASTDPVPAGWSGGWVGDAENFRPGVDWNDVVQSVDQIEVWWLNPAFFAILQTWDVGVDNVCLESGGPITTNYCGPAAPNSTGMGAAISGFGSTFAADNNVTLTASQLPPNQFGYFLNSQTQGFVQGVPNSQGNLCLGGNIGRYRDDVLNSGPAGSFSLTLDLTQTPTNTGVTAILAGETWNFQAWFRDANPNPTSNFTDAMSVDFL